MQVIYSENTSLSDGHLTVRAFAPTNEEKDSSGYYFPSLIIEIRQHSDRFNEDGDPFTEAFYHTYESIPTNKLIREAIKMIDTAIGEDMKKCQTN